MIKPTALDVLGIKSILFKMTMRVMSGQFDARSFVGDTALELRSLLYEDEKLYWTEYDAWKEKQ